MKTSTMTWTASTEIFPNKAAVSTVFLAKLTPKLPYSELKDHCVCVCVSLELQHSSLGVMLGWETFYSVPAIMYLICLFDIIIFFFIEAKMHSPTEMPFFHGKFAASWLNIQSLKASFYLSLYCWHEWLMSTNQDLYLPAHYFIVSLLVIIFSWQNILKRETWASR